MRAPVAWQADSEQQRAKHAAEVEAVRAGAREAAEAHQELAAQLAAALEDCAAEAARSERAAIEQLSGVRAELADAEGRLAAAQAACLCGPFRLVRTAYTSSVIALRQPRPIASSLYLRLLWCGTSARCSRWSRPAPS